METYLTAREVALLFKFSLQTIRRYTMNREIPFHKINRAVRYKQSEIEVWFAERQAAKAKAKNNDFEGGLFDGVDGRGGV
jgi:excisionase family DNA binding protein